MVHFGSTSIKQMQTYYLKLVTLSGTFSRWQKKNFGTQKRKTLPDHLQTLVWCSLPFVAPCCICSCIFLSISCIRFSSASFSCRILSFSVSFSSGRGLQCETNAQCVGLLQNASTPKAATVLVSSEVPLVKSGFQCFEETVLGTKTDAPVLCFRGECTN